MSTDMLQLARFWLCMSPSLIALATPLACLSDTGIKLLLAGSVKEIIYVFSILQEKIGSKAQNWFCQHKAKVVRLQKKDERIIVRNWAINLQFFKISNIPNILMMKITRSVT